MLRKNFMHIKKGFLTMLVCACSIPALTGCAAFGVGGETGAQPEMTQTETTAQPSVGDIVEKDGIKKETVLSNTNYNFEGETGPIEYSIDSIQVAKVTATTDNASKMLDLEKNQEAVMVILSITCKNTWDESANFYISQATIKTNTGELVEPKSLLGEYIDGHVVPGETKKGSNVYLLTKTTVEKLNSLTFHVDAPQNYDFKDMSEDVDEKLIIQ